MQRPNNPSTLLGMVNPSNHRTRVSVGMTLLEMIIALAIVGVILTAILPAFRSIRNSWDSKQASAEALQNGRVLIDHLNRNLSKAVRITDVSESSEADGYIEFEDNDGNNFRYDIADNNYVEFGLIGSLYELAGPVSQLQFTCYDANDFNTPTTNVAQIRCVKVETTLTNAAALGQSKTFTTSAYLRTNVNRGSLVGWWKFDEVSGLTAADSSGSGNNGTLINMAGDEWTTGQINGALTFDGTNDGVNCGNNPSLNLDIGSWGAWVKLDAPKQWAARVIFKERSSTSGTGIYELFDWGGFKAEVVVGGGRYRASSPSSTNTGQWYHLFATYDGETLRLYVNGEEVAANTNPSGNISDNTGPLGLGTRVTDATRAPLYGTIDDVRVYNRALSEEEIAELANVLKYRNFSEKKVGHPFISFVQITTPPVNAGDLLIAAVVTDGDTSASIVPPAGQGWTLINRGAYDGKVTLGAWWKIAGESEPSTHNFTWSGSCQAYGWMMRFTGHDPDDPINAYSFSGESSDNPTSPAVTTTVDNCLILCLGGFDDDDIEVDSPGLPDHTVITMDESCDTSGETITYAGFSETKLSTDGTSITVAKPDGTAEGDFLVAAVATDGDTSDYISAPTGWKNIGCTGYPYVSSSEVTLAVWSKAAGASELADYDFSWTGGGSEQAYGWIIRLTGISFSNGSWPSPMYGTSDEPPCGPSYVGPPSIADVMTLRFGAFDTDAIVEDSPGLPDHNAITMDCSSSGGGSVSGGSGYMTHSGNGPTSNFSLDTIEEVAYVTTSPCIYRSGVYDYTCSGGAGCIKQSAIGSSGTSNFLLGSSNEARMLTIAIAPDPESGEEILP